MIHTKRRSVDSRLVGQFYFQLTHDGRTLRFRLNGDGDTSSLLTSLERRVLAITDSDIVKLYWRDGKSLLLLNDDVDLVTAIDGSTKMNGIPCVALEVEVEKFRDERRVKTRGKVQPGLSKVDRLRHMRATRPIHLTAPAAPSASDQRYITRFGHGGIDFVQWLLAGGVSDVANEEEMKTLYQEYEKERLRSGEVINEKMRDAQEVLEEVRKKRGSKAVNRRLTVNLQPIAASDHHRRYKEGGVDFQQWLLRGGLETLNDGEMIGLYLKYEMERFEVGEAGNGSMKKSSEILEGIRKENAGHRQEVHHRVDPILIAREREMRTDTNYAQASQIPAHLAIGVIGELAGLSVEEMDSKLNDYLRHLFNNTYNLKSHSPIFERTNCPWELDEEVHTGNIAIDLTKHLNSIRSTVCDVRWDNNKEGLVAKLDERVVMLREALAQNGADGEEYEAIAAQVRPLLLTGQYSGGKCNGNWDLQCVGFMVRDPLRDYIDPLRVASANPHKEGLFAPVPEP